MLLGVYKDDLLIQTITLNDVASKALPIKLKQILAEYDIKQIIYVNSPGSFMAIKVSYVTLKTIALLKDIPLAAVDGFSFNQNKPIKAIGKLYFIKEDGTITTKKFEKAVDEEYHLPETIAKLQVSFDNTPKYEIPAV